MIARIWHGWTSPQNADAYETLLKTEIFPGILARSVTGFRRIELLRATAGQEIEFVTVMWFDSLEAVKAFAGPNTKRQWFLRKRARCLAVSIRALRTTKANSAMRVRREQAGRGGSACLSFRSA